MTFIQIVYASVVALVGLVVAYFKHKATKATKALVEEKRQKDLAMERLKEQQQQTKLYEASAKASAKTKKTVKKVKDSLTEVKEKAKEGTDAKTQEEALNMATDIFNGSGAGKL